MLTMSGKYRLVSLVVFIYLAAGLQSAEIKRKDKMQDLAEQIEMMKTLHTTDFFKLTRDVEELKKKQTALIVTNNHERNEKATLQWATKSMGEVRGELKEVRQMVNNSELLQQLHVINNKLQLTLGENRELVQLTQTQEARMDKLDNEVQRLKYEDQQRQKMMAELHSYISKLAKEIKTKQIEEKPESDNEVVEVLPHRHDHHRLRAEHAHKLRHTKMIHSQISRLARSQDQLDQYQQGLQTQILDVQRRLDRCEEPNWNLVSAKVDFLELENKVLRNQLTNTTQKVADFDKVHASVLELREDVEEIENKVDNTLPEFRKEISKFEINITQLNAQSSYIKEDQETLRQSVKAIAVSISNTIDRSDNDRELLKKINDSVGELQTRTKQHFYRLNDHILKSESNHPTNELNLTEVISLPELIGEVKELQPVEREYEDLVNQLPKDCSAVKGPPGAYLIHPGPGPVDAWCANGTTLLQRRYNGSIEFNRKFREYVHGFGDPAGEHWLGLKNMHDLTADNCSSMRIDMTDIYGGYWYAQYEHFSVGSGDGGFVLDVSGFEGNASDAFEYQNHMEFSTVDRDRDISNTDCADNYEGGWWFSHCQHVNINGKYTLGLTWFDSQRNEWIAVATSEMRTFQRPGCA